MYLFEQQIYSDIKYKLTNKDNSPVRAAGLGRTGSEDEATKPLSSPLCIVALKRDNKSGIVRRTMIHSVLNDEAKSGEKKLLLELNSRMSEIR